MLNNEDKKVCKIPDKLQSLVSMTKVEHFLIKIFVFLSGFWITLFSY